MYLYLSISSYISIDGLSWVKYLLSLNSIDSCLPSIQVIQIFVDISDHHFGKYVVSEVNVSYKLLFTVLIL